MCLGICYSVSVAAAKIVLAYQYLHGMDPERALRRSILQRICAALFILQVVEEVLVELLSCHPIQGRAVLKFQGQCLQQRPMWFTGFILNLVFAVNVFAQPMVSLWTRRGLGLSRKMEPLATMLVFAL